MRPLQRVLPTSLQLCQIWATSVSVSLYLVSLGVPVNILVRGVWIFIWYFVTKIVSNVDQSLERCSLGPSFIPRCLLRLGLGNVVWHFPVKSYQWILDFLSFFGWGLEGDFLSRDIGQWAMACSTTFNRPYINVVLSINDVIGHTVLCCTYFFAFSTIFWFYYLKHSILTFLDGWFLCAIGL